VHTPPGASACPGGLTMMPPERRLAFVPAGQVTSSTPPLRRQQSDRRQHGPPRGYERRSRRHSCRASYCCSQRSIWHLDKKRSGRRCPATSTAASSSAETATGARSEPPGGMSRYLIATHRLHSPSGRDLSPPSLAERGRSFNPGTRAGNGDEVFDQSCGARNVSQLATSPDFRPLMNQRVRCAEEPCVKASGTT
jgi:hypothetical protein